LDKKPAKTVPTEALHSMMLATKEMIPTLSYGYWFLSGTHQALQTAKSQLDTCQPSPGSAVQSALSALEDASGFLASLDVAYLDTLHQQSALFANQNLLLRDTHMGILSSLLQPEDKKQLRYQPVTCKDVFPSAADTVKKLEVVAQREANKGIVRLASAPAPKPASQSKKRSSGPQHRPSGKPPGPTPRAPSGQPYVRSGGRGGGNANTGATRRGGQSGGRGSGRKGKSK
jgi:hypothetical protein